ncbi:Down syndrome cell adhesion molecule, partial [Plakobranchus ocellatus]
SVEAAQYFIERPRDEQVVQGSTTFIKCRIGARKGDVQWTKGGFSLGFNRTIPGFPRYSIKSDRDDQFDLMIVDVRLTDDDEYSCQVLPGGGDGPLLAKAYLHVLVPNEAPTILNYGNGSTVEVPYTQENLELVCEARNGKPAATIEWFLNGNMRLTSNITQVDGKEPGSKLFTATSTLTIPLSNYRQQNGNVYTCRAYNIALIGPKPSTTVDLSILYPPGPPQLEGYNGRVLRVGITLSLRCTSQGGNPTGKVIWYRNGRGIDWSSRTTENRDSSLSHSVNEYSFAVTADDDNAVYSCHVTSEAMLDLPPQTANYTLTVNYPPKTVTMSGVSEPVRVNREVTLTCTTSRSNPKARITWYADSSQVPSQQFTENFIQSPQGGHITVSTMTIRAGVDDHNKVFTCRAKNIEFNSLIVSDTLTLSVLYPPSRPEITGYQQGRKLRAGTRKELICRTIGGNPLADLKWYKGNTRLTENVTFDSVGSVARSVLLLDVRPSDNQAVYKCKASNQATATPLEVQVRLAVNFPPAAVSISMNPPQARVGQQVDLTCRSSSSNPQAEIVWSRNNRRMTGTDLGTEAAENGGRNRTSRLRFQATSRDHNAVYSCTATNMVLGVGATNAVTLNVLFKPEFDVGTLPTTVDMKKGERGRINLTAVANPPQVTYQLFKDGNRLTNLPSHLDFSQGVLNISTVEKSDKGSYMVRATNPQGTTSFNFSIVVKYPAAVLRVSGPQSIPEGEQAVFVCEADAYPVVLNMFTWFREGFDTSRFRTKQEGSISTMTIDRLRREDAGKFKCIVDNRVGAPNHDYAELVVEFSPVIDKSPELSRSAGPIGTDVTLRCNADGAPEVGITWTRKNTQVQSNGKYMVNTTQVGPQYKSKLKIKSVSKDDHGAYVCTATNTRGSDSFSISLAGTSKPYPPYNVYFVNATARSITVAWKAGFNGGLAQSFRVRYKPTDARGFVYVDVRPFGALSFKIKGLQMDTEYEITVMAFNDLGESAYHIPILTARTLGQNCGQQPCTWTQSNTQRRKDKEIAADVATSDLQGSDETPVIIILVVCIVGVFILTLNVGLILFFIRKRKKRLEGTSDTTSHTNTFELYGSNNKGDNNMYPPPPSDDTRSYGTYDKSMDDFSDDYIRDYDLDYPGSRPYSPSQKLGPAESPRLLGGGHKITTYIAEDKPGRISPWSEDPYKRAHPSHRKGSYENGVPNGDVYEFKSARGKGMNELSERPTNRPPSRSGKTPPPPPVRSSSRCGSLGLGVGPPSSKADMLGEEADDNDDRCRPSSRPPLPARNYQPQEILPSPMPSYSPPPAPRYGPMPGSTSVLSPNIVANPNYKGPLSSFTNGGPNYSTATTTANINPQNHYGQPPASRTSPYKSNNYTSSSNSIHRPPPSPHNTVPAGSEFRGHLV